MLKGQVSATAQFIAYNRALGTLAPQVPGFSDPVARRLLSGSWAARVARAQARLRRSPSVSPFPFWMRGMGLFNQFRTVMLDRAILAALPLEQLVILGAGLDGRAWRLPPLAATAVFELDHPATQAWKRDQAAPLPVVARQVRFVPMDFRTDHLAERLAASGYEHDRSSFWLCEGVIMYLSLKETLRLLAGAATQAAPGCRLALTYMASEDGRMPRGLALGMLALLGEPMRSAHDPDALALAAAAAGWHTVSDTGIQDWQPAVAPGLKVTERSVGFQWSERIWIGERA